MKFKVGMAVLPTAEYIEQYPSLRHATSGVILKDDLGAMPYSIVFKNKNVVLGRWWASKNDIVPMETELNKRDIRTLLKVSND